jgi:TonB family protein
MRRALTFAALFSLLSSEVGAQEPALPSQPARGQPASAPPPVDPNAVSEPKLLATVDAPYPSDAPADLPEPAVEMVLVIGQDGYVEKAELAGEPVGYGFDELALQAARRFLFEPATKGGVPMRARVRFRYQFKRPAPVPEARPEPRAEGRLELIVATQEGEPLAGAEVLVIPQAEPDHVIRLISDEKGAAMADALPEGSYDVTVSKEGYSPEVHEEQVRAGEAVEIKYRLSEEQKSFEEFGAVARVRAPPREVTRRTIEREELTRVAGTRGDALRTIELLPGVARPPFSAGLVLIRGSAPGDSQVFMDGSPVPLLYHFGGLTSFINSRALQRIDFYPGNFSARYGRHIGGIIDVEPRDPASDGYHGVLDMNLPLDSSLLVEGPITDKASFLVAGRRSYFGEVATAVIPEGTFSSFAAPVYYDYQAFVTYRPTPRDKLRFGAYGSSDRLEVLFADAPDQDPSIRQIELGVSFHRQQINWDHQFSSRLDQHTQFSFGRIDQAFAAGPDADFELGVNDFYGRSEWRYRVSDQVKVTGGVDAQIDMNDVSYRGPAPEQQEGNVNGAPFSQRPTVDIHDTPTTSQPAVYGELDLRPIPELRIIPGIRLDYFSAIDHFAFDPRIAAIYSVSDTFRVKAGVGVFSQAPEPQESSSTLVGNPNLVPIRAIHYSAGVEKNFTEDLSLGVEGFYKSLYDRVVTPDRAVDPRPFVNDGIGRIYGLEVSGRKMAKGRWFGFLSYTLMRSERKDDNHGWRLFDFDQTHILSAAATVLMNKNWELGATFRVVSGNPQTPILPNGIADLDTGLYTPVAGRTNSTRAPTFNRLDLRVQKTWKFDSWKLAWYLDIQNTYNATNREGTAYNYNYRESGPIRGLPIIPILGLRGEL